MKQSKWKRVANKRLSDTFVCWVCGKTFVKGLTKAEAEAQFQKEYPGIDLNEQTDCYSCETCFQKMNAIINSKEATQFHLNMGAVADHIQMVGPAYSWVILENTEPKYRTEISRWNYYEFYEHNDTDTLMFLREWILRTDLTPQRCAYMQFMIKKLLKLIKIMEYLIKCEAMSPEKVFNYLRCCPSCHQPLCLKATTDDDFWCECINPTCDLKGRLQRGIHDYDMMAKRPEEQTIAERFGWNTNEP